VTSDDRKFFFEEASQTTVWQDFDKYCDAHEIKPGEEPAAFAAFLHEKTGWDGSMRSLSPELVQHLEARTQFPMMDVRADSTITVEPHLYKRRPFRIGICDHCYFPKKRHPTTKWERARSLHDNRFMNFRSE
jgi:hypothetical protein